MRRIALIGGAAGIGAIALYMILAGASYGLYPAAYNPRDNWLSDLGNASLNPSGSLLYRVDAVVVGILVALFFVGFSGIAGGEGKKVRIFLLLAQCFGWVAALALIMTGIFSEGAHASHSLWSVILYISFGMAVFLSGWGFRRSYSFPRSLAYLSFTVTVIIWVMAAFNKTYFLEWIVVALLLVYVGVVSRRMLIAGRSMRIAATTSLR